MHICVCVYVDVYIIINNDTNAINVIIRMIIHVINMFELISISSITIDIIIVIIFIIIIIIIIIISIGITIIIISIISITITITIIIIIIISSSSNSTLSSAQVVAPGALVRRALLFV